MESLIYYSSCPSTQDEIINFINLHDFRGGFLGLYTFEQTQGRGQYGNLWENNPGENLAYSFALKLQNKTYDDTTLNFYTAILIRDFIANLTHTDPKIKWPNDLILGDKKIGGMLFEKKAGHLITGIGINILQENFEELPYAGSLFTQTGASLDLKAFAESLHGFLTEKLQDNPLPEDVIAVYNTHLYRKNEIAVFEKNNTRQNGIIKKVDGEGFLHIELEQDGLQKFFHKEIALLY